jgi:hypothetical protein
MKMVLARMVGSESGGGAAAHLVAAPSKAVTKIRPAIITTMVIMGSVSVVAGGRL